MKIIACLLINKSIRNQEALEEYLKNIDTYMPYIDELYIYNLTTSNLEEFYERLTKYEHIKYADTTDMGEVANYEMAMKKMLKEKADFGIVLELGYFYEEDTIQNIKKFILEHDYQDIAVITPMPLLGCQIHERKSEQWRTIKGCKLVGTFINMQLFMNSGGFKLDYYQTTFDYEYCLRMRHRNYRVILLPNEVLRNINYRVIERKIFFTTLSTYDRDLMDVYYETRNRFYLWDEYLKIDYEYVKLDQKLYKDERHEMRFRDKEYKDKFLMMEVAKKDYQKGLKGKYIGKV